MWEKPFTSGMHSLSLGGVESGLNESILQCHDNRYATASFVDSFVTCRSNALRKEWVVSFAFEHCSSQVRTLVVHQSCTACTVLDPRACSGAH